MRQGELLGLNRGNFQRSRPGHRRLILLLARPLVDAQDLDVLQENIGDQCVVIPLAGKQDVHLVTRDDEPGNAGYVVDADGDGAHFLCDDGRHRRPLAEACHHGRQDRLAGFDGPTHHPGLLSADKLIRCFEGARRNAVERPFDLANMLGAELVAVDHLRACDDDGCERNGRLFDGRHGGLYLLLKPVARHKDRDGP